MWLRAIEEIIRHQTLCPYPCHTGMGGNTYTHEHTGIHTHTYTHTTQDCSPQASHDLCLLSPKVTPPTCPFHYRHTGFLPTLKFAKCFSNGLWVRVPTYITINMWTPVNPIYNWISPVKGNQLIQPSWKKQCLLGGHLSSSEQKSHNYVVKLFILHKMCLNGCGI